jgi:hypothetical protein
MACSASPDHPVRCACRIGPSSGGRVITSARTDRVCASGWIAVGMAAARLLRTSPDRSHGAAKSRAEEMPIIGSGRRPARLPTAAMSRAGAIGTGAYNHPAVADGLRS